MVAVSTDHCFQREDRSIMADDTAAPDVIMARRSSDGYLTFDLKISHIIEQTLRRAFNRPDFRKSTIKVVDEADLATSDNNNLSDTKKLPNMKTKRIKSSPSEESSAMTRSLNCKSLEAVKRSHSEGSLYTGVSTSSESTSSAKGYSMAAIDDDVTQQEADLFIKRLCQRRENEEPIQAEPVSAIPIDWIERGLSVEEKKQFQRSIANASLCPYERNRSLDRVEKQTVGGTCISPERDRSPDIEVDDPFEDPVDLPSSDDQSSNHCSESSVCTSTAPQLYIPEDCKRSVTESVAESEAVSVSSYYSLADDITEQVSLDSFSGHMSDHMRSLADDAFIS